AQEQLAFNKEQLEKSKPLDHLQGKLIVDHLKTLSKVLSENLQIISKIEELYSKQINALEEIRESVLNLAMSFDQQIEKKQKQVLFDRTENLLASMQWQRIPEEIERIFSQANQLISLEFWTKQVRFMWKATGFLLIKAILLFGITQLLVLRLRRFCSILMVQVKERKVWLALTMDLFQRSLLLLGTLLFIYIYANLQDLYSGLPFTAVVVDILLTWLITAWFLDLLKLLSRTRYNWLPEKMSARLRALLRAIRFFAMAYLTLQWTLGGASSLLLLARVFFEIGLIIWIVCFWRMFRQMSLESSLTASPRWWPSVRLSLIGWGYATGVGGLVLELAGYGQLALYWYASWGRTFGVTLWGTLLFLMLREWDRAVSSVPVSNRKGSHHLRWLLIRLLWVAWLGAIAAFLLIAWGARKTVVLGFFSILNQSIKLGEMQFNLLGIAYGFLLLTFTLAATRFWRQVLKKRILADSGIELGLQESITTVSVYILWIFGILAALHALGVGTTSLTVAFGALGIGLGFGLQNIFNNFISGIILLFERPIQVGEIIEIGETWGTVRKINFRSTVVQTYDNASLIIPNSDFISSQVINWSFKDPRLRRSVSVGVAYGSDIRLVRDTLLEIADSHPQVLKYPKYDVLFTDFGDSALIFKLRFWSTLSDFLAVETEIRFEIDRLFQERGIEISFPQRDINIRTIVPDLTVRLKKDDTPELNE
ncbi:MAG: mechanosensitive ion channel, partial [Desulforhabdus sp.]|nr:mechanosensitive ion channel [Desulforhabdus sp.]